MLSIVFNIYCLFALYLLIRVSNTGSVNDDKRTSIIFNFGYIVVALANTHNREKLSGYDWMDDIFYFLVITGSIIRCYDLSRISKKLLNGKDIQQRGFSMDKRKLSKTEN